MNRGARRNGRNPSRKRPTDIKVTLETLRASQDIRDMLWPFDFALTSNKEFGPVRFDTVPLQPFEIVAQRGSGCVYALTGPQRHVLLATSEGQAGVVAAAASNGHDLAAGTVAGK